MKNIGPIFIILVGEIVERNKLIIIGMASISTFKTIENVVFPFFDPDGPIEGLPHHSIMGGQSPDPFNGNGFIATSVEAHGEEENVI